MKKILLLTMVLFSAAYLYSIVTSTWRVTVRNKTNPALSISVVRIPYTSFSTHLKPDLRFIHPNSETTFEAINTSSVENPVQIMGIVFAGWANCEGASTVTNRFMFGMRPLIVQAIKDGIIKGGPLTENDQVIEGVEPGGIYNITNAGHCGIKLGKLDIPRLSGQIKFYKELTPFGL